MGVLLLIAALVGGGWVASHPIGAAFTLTGTTLTWMMMGYGVHRVGVAGMDAARPA